MIKNKKAMENESLSNIGKIILAIAALLILWFGTKELFAITAEKNDLKNAESLTQILEGKVNAFLDSEFQEATIDINGFNPEWFITGWGKNSPSRPEKCFFDTCICISDGKSATKCDSSPLPPAKINAENIEIKTYVFSKYGAAKCYQYNSISLPKKLFNIYLTKKDSSLSIEFFLQEDKPSELSQIEKPKNYDLKNCEPVPDFG